MKKIIVAEDEPNIALALQTILEKGIKGSKVYVAENGMEALSFFQNNKIDLVLSDWNMPVMSGSELLSVIRTSDYNSTVPFLMLTARADSESVKSAISSDVTEYIVKPFDKSGLIEKITAVLGVDDNLSNDTGKQENISIYKKIMDLIYVRVTKGYLKFPVMPEISMKAVEIINNENNSTEEIAALIRSDQSMAGKIMSVSNSSFYRGQVPIETVESALTRIGLKETGNIILAFFLRELSGNVKGQFGIRLKKMWEHSLMTAVVAKMIATELDYDNKERFYAAGLLHDIGKLLLMPVLKDLKKSHKELTEAVIDEVLSALHVRVGAELLRHWNFSLFFINIVRRHHDIGDLSEIKPEVKVVMLANCLSKVMDSQFSELNLEEGVISSLSHDLGLDKVSINKIMSKSTDDVMQVKTFFYP